MAHTTRRRKDFHFLSLYCAVYTTHMLEKPICQSNWQYLCN